MLGAMTSIVFAPGDLVIATSDGIDVRFGGIELDTDVPPGPQRLEGGKGIRLRLEGVRGEETQRRDVLFLDARDTWIRRMKAQGLEAAGPSPTMPGVPVLERVNALLDDGLGTDYRCVKGQVAGDGTEWEASWVYLPNPPEAARNLRIWFTLDGIPTGRDCELQLR
jgi:hypothetical protein